MHKIFNVIKKHKILAGIFLIILAVGSYFAYKNFNKSVAQIRYVLASVETGSIITSVSGSGQVSVLDETTIKSETSADIIYLGVVKGDNVRVGQLLIKLDTENAKDAIETAQENLDNAKSALDKIVGYETESGSVRGTKEKAQDALDTSYKDGFNIVENAFLDLPSVVSGFYSILFGNSFSTYQSNLDYYVNSVGPYNETALEYKDDVYAKYQIAKNLYDKNLSDYKKTSRDSGTEEIEALISQTYDTVKAISDAAKSANNLIQYYQEKIEGKGSTPVALSDTHLASAQSYMSKANSYSSSLLSVKNTIQNSKESLIEIDFDIADQEKQVKKAEDALINAKEDLNDYSIFSPSSGVITVLNVEKDGSVSSGANLMTLAANQKIAEITLNEVDVANVKVGQKTNLTFDAIDDLNITGTVSEIDTTGTVSQGVVSYGVTIIFDMQDERVKSGMTVSATIITEVKQNVLVVASSAIKTSGGISYVEVLSDVDILSGASSTGVIAKILPTQQTVTVGLSDDIFVEITSGLKEGDLIVAKTTTSASKSSSSNNSQTQGSGANSLLQAVSGGTGARMPSGGPGF